MFNLKMLRYKIIVAPRKFPERRPIKKTCRGVGSASRSALSRVPQYYYSIVVQVTAAAVAEDEKLYHTYEMLLFFPPFFFTASSTRAQDD